MAVRVDDAPSGGSTCQESALWRCLSSNRSKTPYGVQVRNVGKTGKAEFKNNAHTSIANLLNDAKHIAETNGMALLGYLIGMALLQLENEIISRDLRLSMVRRSPIHP